MQRGLIFGIDETGMGVHNSMGPAVVVTVA